MNGRSGQMVESYFLKRQAREFGNSLRNQSHDLSKKIKQVAILEAEFRIAKTVRL